MAEYQQPFSAPALDMPPPPARRRLALELVLDLVILVVLLIVLALLALLAILGFRVVLQGVPLAELSNLSGPNQLELIGVGGVFLLLLVQNTLFVALPVVRTRLLRREPLARIGLQAPQPLRLVLFGLLLGVLVLIGNAALGALFASFGVRQNQADQYPLFQGDFAGQALFMLGAAVVVPIGEEVLFRGYIFSTLRRIGAGTAWGTPLAFVLSALLFGLAHGLAATEGVLGLIVPTLVMGLLLAWGVNRTGSIVPDIIAHAMNNGVALLALVTCINNPGMCPGF